MRRRVASLVALPLVALAAACGGDDAPTEKTFAEEGAPYRFTYPATMEEVFADTGKEIRGRKPTYRRAVGTDATNVVVAATYRLRRPFEDYDREEFRSSVDAAVRAIAKGARLDLVERQDGRLGPLDAWVYELARDDGSLDTRLVYGFRGRTQYFLRCQWDPTGSEVVPGACDLAQRSFAPVDGA